MRFLKRISLLVASSLLSVWALSAPVLRAQNDPASNPASGLRVSPTRAELTVAPGASDTARFTITNVTGGNIVVRSEVNDFEANPDGSVKLQAEGAEPTANSIKPFVAALPDQPLAAGESYDAVVDVNIPGGTAPGAYYGTMLFQAVPITAEGEEPGQVALSGSVGTIILIQVPGDVTEKMQLISMRAAREVKADTDAPEIKPGTLFNKPPTKIQVTVKNVGNSFLKPFGTVSVQNWQGKEVYSYGINNTDPRGNVLPNTERVFTNDLENIGWFGRYTIISGITYGDGGDILTQESTFWVIPLWLVAVVVALIVLLVAGVVMIIRKIKKRK